MSTNGNLGKDYMEFFILFLKHFCTIETSWFFFFKENYTILPGPLVTYKWEEDIDWKGQGLRSFFSVCIHYCLDWTLKTGKFLLSYKGKLNFNFTELN